MKISLIAAVAENNVIGNANDLVWHLPADMRYFKNKTTGHHIVMGRNTFESIGGGRLLPNRTSVILTRNTTFSIEGAIVVHSLQDAINVCSNDEEIFIIGGAQIYAQAIDLADTLYITLVKESFDGDVVFPQIDMHIWEIIDVEDHEPDEKNKYKYSFLTYKRRKIR